MNNTLLRTMVRGAYDLQKQRIQFGNRIAANFRVKLGLEPSQKAEDDAEAANVLKELVRRYRLITDGMVELSRRRRFEYDGVISTYAELCIINHYLQIQAQEARQFRDLVHELKTYDIYTTFLESVKGVGPAMAGVITSEIDITKAKYASSVWRYAGLDVGPDGRGRSRRAEHLEERAYVDKNGETQTRRGLTFNPFLKTKLTGVLATSFLRCGSEYRDHYDRYRHRIDHHKTHAEKSDGHRHNMALRYMIKMFLIDLYMHWRALEGLEVHDPYHEAKLGHVHGPKP